MCRLIWNGGLGKPSLVARSEAFMAKHAARYILIQDVSELFYEGEIWLVVIVFLSDLHT